MIVNDKEKKYDDDDDDKRKESWIMARINNSRKALFQTPSGINGISLASEEHSVSTLANSLLSKLDIAEKALANGHAGNEYNLSSKDSHKERLTKLKVLLNEIDEDNWKYENVSKLIGIWIDENICL